MADAYLMRHALRRMLDQFVDGKPKHVLFTSFNFSASFFENNVLPLLCGNAIDEIKGAKLTRDMLNQQLADIETVVVCDRSAHPEPKGNLRYGLMTVGLEHGRFHPKIILMAGTLLNSKYGLWLSVASGNLSYSGWSVQREVVGTTPVTVSHANELRALLSWLIIQAEAKVAITSGNGPAAPGVKEEGEIRKVLKALHDSLLDAISDAQDPSLPSLHLALPPDVALDHRPLLKALLGDQPWESATVISPFWGGVSTLMREVQADHYRFVPSVQPTGGYGYPVVNEEEIGRISYRRFAQDPDRYTHAKALMLERQGKRVLCIGSANFTTAALLHGQGTLSNVEAMLRYDVSGTDPWAGMLENLDRGESLAENGTEEGAPPLPPFDADVSYDWRSKQFHCSVTLNKNARLTRLVMEVGVTQLPFDFAKITQQRKVIKSVLRQPVRSYKLVYDDGKMTEVFVGLVTQLNAADDELAYSPRPRLDLILEFLHGLVPGKGKGRNGGGGGGDDPDGEDIAEPAFDFFSFFLATEKLRRYYSEPGDGDESPFGHSTSGIPTLYRAVSLQADASTEAKIGRYVQLAEVLDTIDFFSKGKLREHEGDRVTMQRDISSELERLEREIAPLLYKSPQWTAMFAPKRTSAHTFLKWFRKELKLRQGNP